MHTKSQVKDDVCICVFPEFCPSIASLHQHIMNLWFNQLSKSGTVYRHKVLPSQGFTLLELLVSIVVVGILSALAIPSFLSFSMRSRHAEAQLNVGSILRAQQAYFMWNNEFATTLPVLELGILDSRHYEYRTHDFTNHRTLNGDQVDGVIAIAVPLSNVRGYMGKAWIDAATGLPELKSVMCEGDTGASYFMNNRTYCQ